MDDIKKIAKKIPNTFILLMKKVGGKHIHWEFPFIFSFSFSSFSFPTTFTLFFFRCILISYKLRKKKMSTLSQNPRSTVYFPPHFSPSISSIIPVIFLPSKHPKSLSISYLKRQKESQQSRMAAESDICWSIVWSSDVLFSHPKASFIIYQRLKCDFLYVFHHPFYSFL